MSDSSSSEAAHAQEVARLSKAMADLIEAKAVYAAIKASLAEAEGRLTRSEADLTRSEALFDRAEARLDAYTTNLDREREKWEKAGCPDHGVFYDNLVFARRANEAEKGVAQKDTAEARIATAEARKKVDAAEGDVKRLREELAAANTAVQRLTDEVQVVRSEQDPRGGSEYTSSEGSVLEAGMFFSRPFAWAKVPQYAEALAVVTADEIAEVEKLLHAVVALSTRADFVKVGETETGKSGWSVQADILSCLSSLLTVGNTITGNTSSYQMQRLGCGSGLASSTSIMDFFVLDSNAVRANIEAKDTTTAPEDALRQSVAYATNIAASQRLLGVAAEDVCIPLAGMTGRLFQFACAQALEPCFPYVVIVSEVLDILNSRDRRVICQHLLAMRRICLVPLRVYEANVLTLHTPLVGTALSTARYHLKLERDFFAAYGPEFGRDDNSPMADKARNVSLYHMAEVLERLHDCECAVLPLTFRHCKGRVNRGLVFPKLQGYTIGFTPGDLAFNERLVEAIAAALGTIHARGVVHMDFYLSNLMWKVLEDGSIDVRVVDWDSVCFEGEVLPLKMLSRLTKSPRYTLYKKNEAIPEYDTFFVDVMRHTLSDGTWESLAVGEKNRLDEAFRAACLNYDVKYLGAQSAEAVVLGPLEKKPRGDVM